MSVTDTLMREPGLGFTPLDYSRELHGLLVYPRLRPEPAQLSIETSATLSVLCASIGLVHRENFSAKGPAREGTLVPVEDGYILFDTGPLGLPEATAGFFRSLRLLPCE